MSANNDLQKKLQAGIEAVRNGDRTTGRRLLEEVIAEDANNELAWMWLASAVTTLSERRTCLQKALQINPNNQRASEALKRLQGERQQAGASESARQFEQLRQAQRSVQSRGRDDSSSESTGRSLPFLSMGTLMIAGLVILGIVGIGLIGSVVFTPAPTPTAVPVILPTSRPTNTPVPTATSFVVDANAITRSAATLPPTFTPTATFTPTITLTPSPTPFPPSIFDALYTSREILNETADIYAINGDGSGERKVVEGAWDVNYGWDGNFVAYAKNVTYPADDDVPEDTTVSEIFFGPATAPEVAEQVTRLRVRNAYSPTISPTGRQIVFVSDWDGDDDLWLLDLDSGATSQLTFNNYIDRDPHWSPDGSMLVFTSDRDTPGFTDLYTLTFVVVESPNPDESPHIVERLNNASGSSYSPRWSPDGSKVVFINDRGGDGDVYIMDADGQRPTLITVDDGDAEDRSPDFSPDGRLIGFISNREDNIFQVYLINQQGRELTRIIDNSREAESIRFKPDVQLLFPGS